MPRPKNEIFPITRKKIPQDSLLLKVIEAVEEEAIRCRINTYENLAIHPEDAATLYKLL